MAEVAGLIIGVVALAGIFKDCIDLFGYISASRHLTKDFDLLDTKLDVEKTLLLQWAERLRLLSQHHDSRLEDAHIEHAISRILSSIKLLLSDSANLQHRYGACAAADPSISMSSPVITVSGSAVLGTRATLSEARMQQFLSDFRDLTVRARIREPVTVLRRVRWVIHDKEKFETLINQLSYFISKLNEIVPDTYGVLGPMIEQDLGKLYFDRLKVIYQASVGREPLMAITTERAIDYNCTQRIKRRFWYRAIDDRRFSLANPHASTLRWALEPRDEESGGEWDDLAQWLQHGSGIYWVSGKAGSGKSTLVKYLYEHQKTKKLLAQWSGDNPLTMANYFFYALGVDEQKSQEGLVRALLYQIITAEPTIIPLILPNMWQEAHVSDEIQLALPSRGETAEAFSIMQSGLGISRKFCFFIDGLDEFAGNPTHAVSFIERLSTNEDIKVLISSRPISSCVQAFSHKPKLQLQDLTLQDIVSYVNDTIGANPYYQRLVVLEGENATRIFQELANKSSGVFLWVVLACRSLMEGFAAYDNVAELRKRVDELPPELESLFQHMLGKIEARYRNEAAKILRLCYQNQINNDPLDLVCFAIFDASTIDPTNVSLPRDFSDAEKRAKCEIFEGRLRSRCYGLLEVLPRNRDKNSRCFCNMARHVHEDEHDQLIDAKIIFLHRTVFDFLAEPAVWDLPSLYIGDPLFNEDALLAGLSLQALKLSASYKFRGEGLGLSCLCRFMSHAVQADSSAPHLITPAFFKLEWLLRQILQENPLQLLPLMSRVASSDIMDYFRADVPFALLFAVEAGMTNFLRSHARRTKFPSNLTHVLHMHATSQPYLNAIHWHQTSSCARNVHEIVDILEHCFGSINKPTTELQLPSHARTGEKRKSPSDTRSGDSEDEDQTGQLWKRIATDRKT